MVLKLRKKIGLVLLLLIAFLITKLLWFSPWNQQRANQVAMETLSHFAEDNKLNSNKFGTPGNVYGNNEEGYVFKWRVPAENHNGYTDLIITISKLDDDLRFEGIKPDCRAGRDQETRAAGFGYLCE